MTPLNNTILIDTQNIPTELQALNQWVIWREETRGGSSKPTKVPYCAEEPSYKASSSNPKHWSSLDSAMEAAERTGASGIGFVFTKDDTYVGIDIDKREKVSEVRRMVTSYAEESVSGRGVHIIVKGSIPRSFNDSESGVECYDHGRYFAFTGRILDGSPSYVMSDQAALDKFFKTYAPAREPMIPQTRGLPGYDDSPANQQKFIAYLSRRAPAVEGFGGDKHTFITACNGKDLGLSPSVTLDLMKEHWNPTCIPQWDDIGMEEKVRSAYLNGVNAMGCKHSAVLMGLGMPDGQDTEPAPEDPKPVALDARPILAATGAVGDVYQYMMETARYPQPPFAMAAAAVTVSTVMGSRYRTSCGTYGNMYAMCIGASGCGKEGQRNGIKGSLKGAGMLRRFMSDSVASGQGIEDALVRESTGVLILDEIGKALGDMKAGKDDHGVIKALLALYSASGGSYRTRPRAGTAPPIIENPYLCVYGTATPESFHRALEGADAENGWIGRLQVFTSDTARPYYQEPDTTAQVPQSLREVSRITNPFLTFLGVDEELPEGDVQPLLPPTTVGYSDEVMLAKKKLVGEVDQWLRDNPDSKVRSPRVRLVEITVKMALIHAVGRNPAEPLIEREDWDWGLAMSEYSSDILRREVMPNVTSSVNEAQINKLLKVIKDARSCKDAKFSKVTSQGYMPRRLLIQKVRDVDSGARDKMLESLLEEGAIGIKRGCEDFQGAVYYIPKEEEG